MLFADVATAIADAAANTASSSMLHILAIIDAVHYHRHRLWLLFFSFLHSNFSLNQCELPL